ncbi:MAG: hypothetical protein ACYC6Y_08445, partial [Thermoguttaceae bacterium]
MVPVRGSQFPARELHPVEPSQFSRHIHERSGYRHEDQRPEDDWQEIEATPTQTARTQTKPRRNKRHQNSIDRRQAVECGKKQIGRIKGSGAILFGTGRIKGSGAILFGSIVARAVGVGKQAAARWREMDRE